MERLTTARVALLDESNRVLLVRCVDPASGESVWLTPGGSIERTETAAEAAKRELAEETGVTDAMLGPCVYVRENDFTHAGIDYLAQESIFVARVRHPGSPRANGTDDEGEIVAEVRWWSQEDLAQTDVDVSPPNLASLIPEWAQVRFANLS